MSKLPSDLESQVLAAIRDVPDFPKPGILFKDITPLLADGPLFQRVIAWMAEGWAEIGVDKVIGMEARGFLFASPLAAQLGVGLVPVRRPGKLPHATDIEHYELEYGTGALEMHVDALRPGERVLIVDDLLATGGTFNATAALARRRGAEVIGGQFLIELGFLHGRAKLNIPRARTLVTY